VHDPERQELNAVVYDQDFIGADKEVGRASLAIKDLPNGDTQTHWLAINPPSSAMSHNPVSMGIAVPLLPLSLIPWGDKSALRCTVPA